MTREEAIEILIAEAVCASPILSCDFCARCVVMGNHCTHPTDKEVEEAVLLLKGASNDMAISALRQQEHFRDLTKKVEPLTNAQKIRSMSDEELAKLLLHGCRGSNCEDQPQNEFGIVNCFQCRLNWLQQPAGEEET